MNSGDPEKKGKRVFKELTPAHIREPMGAEYVEVVFLESARFYKLPRKNARFEKLLGELRDAVEKKRTLRVLMNIPEGDVIEDVELL